MAMHHDIMMKSKDLQESAFMSLLALVDDIVDGILKLELSRTERVSAQLTREIFARKIPFSDKAALLETKSF